MAEVVEPKIPVRFNLVVDGRTCVHEFALDSDVNLQAGDHVELVSGGAPARRAVLTEIDSEGHLHLQLSSSGPPAERSRAASCSIVGRDGVDLAR